MRKIVYKVLGFAIIISAFAYYLFGVKCYCSCSNGVLYCQKEANRYKHEYLVAIELASKAKERYGWTDEQEDSCRQAIRANIRNYDTMFVPFLMLFD